MCETALTAWGTFAVACVPGPVVTPVWGAWWTPRVWGWHPHRHWWR